MIIHDLPDSVVSKTLLFADDSIIYKNVKYTQDCDVLQDDLRKLATWEETWGMLFHSDKCYVLRISRARLSIKFYHSLKGHKLAAETQSKYLGVDISSNLSWNPHLDRIVKKGNSVRFPSKKLTCE